MQFKVVLWRCLPAVSWGGDCLVLAVLETPVLFQHRNYETLGVVC